MRRAVRCGTELILERCFLPVRIQSVPGERHSPGSSSEHRTGAVPCFLGRTRRAAPRGRRGTDGLMRAMNATSDKNARLSRDVQAKIGQKLALLYSPILRQDLPRQLSSFPGASQSPIILRTRAAHGQLKSCRDCVDASVADEPLSPGRLIPPYHVRPPQRRPPWRRLILPCSNGAALS